MVKSLITFLLSLALVSPVAAQVSGSADAQVGVGVSGSAGGVNVGGQAQVQTDVKTPRDRATGQATGRAAGGLSACQAACRQNNQGNQAAIDACLRDCNNVGPAAGARLLPTVNKIIETREASTGQITVRKEVDKATPLLMKAALDARRAEVKGEIEKRHVELKTKLAAFKNKVKAEIAGRIADNLTKLNERLTDQMAAQIDKMKNIMARVAAGDVNGDGAADIAAANTAIADAAAAVTAQAGKTYTVNVTTEAKIKVDVGAARQQLHDDLKVVEDKMQAARQAVRKAVADVLKLAPSASVNASGSVITQ